MTGRKLDAVVANCACAHSYRLKIFARIIPMDQITIKTPNPKSRLYWCLIEFIGDTVSHVGIFDSSSELAPL